MHKPTDYTFLHLGGLYEAIFEATLEACKRFGADKASMVISTALYYYEKTSLEGLRHEIHEETGLTISTNDYDFLGNIVGVNSLIVSATKHLEEGCHGKS